MLTHFFRDTRIEYCNKLINRDTDMMTKKKMRLFVSNPKIKTDSNVHVLKNIYSNYLGMQRIKQAEITNVIHFWKTL